MTVARSVADVLTDHVVFEVECIDRMYLNVYVPQLQYAGGLIGYLRGQLGCPVTSTAPLGKITDAFAAAMRRFARDQRVPWVDFVKGQRKDDVMAQHLADFTAEEGVVFIGRAQEKTQLFRTERRRDANEDAYPWIVPSMGMVNHFYVYAVDGDFGPFFLKFCSYFPYTAKLCLNGHHWAQRQAAKAGLGFEAMDNAFASVADPDARPPGLRADLLRAGHPGQPRPRSTRPGLAGVQPSDPPPWATGHPGRFRTRVITEGVTPSLHIDNKYTVIKQYHKEGRALRTETTINGTRDFGIGKLQTHLPALREIGLNANRRLLVVQRLSHDPAAGAAAFAAVNNPITEPGGQRVAGLRFTDPRAQALLQALLVFRLLPHGFANHDLRRLVAPLLGRDPADLKAGQMAYDLRRLRKHGLIDRVPHTHRYRVTNTGLERAPFLTRAHDRLLRTGPAQLAEATPAPLRSASHRYQAALDTLTRDSGLAA